MGLKNLIGFKIGKQKEKPDSTAEARHALATKMAVLEEQVNNKTRELAEAEQQIKKLAVSADGSEEDTTPRPHGPLVELEVEPADEDTGVGTLLGEATEEVKTTEVKTTEVKAVSTEAVTAPAAPAAMAATPAVTDATGDDSLSNLFSQDEDEENPLAALINSLPDVSAQELLDDLQEIKAIILESQPK